MPTLTLTEAPDLAVDRDGILKPYTWPSMRTWEAQPVAWRRKRSAQHLEAIAKALAAKPKENRTGMGATWYSTKACVKWGTSKGWVEIAREKYDHRLKRLSDVLLGTDVIFLADGKVVAVQAAGKSEWKRHHQRFLDRGGIEKAERLKVEVWYAEFVRDALEPVLLERWA